MTESQAVRLSTPSNLVHKLYKYKKKKKKLTSKFFKSALIKFYLGGRCVAAAWCRRSFPHTRPALCSPINQQKSQY